MFASPILIAIGIPLILLFMGSMVRKVIRGPGFKAEDFYFGLELALATLGASLTNFIDISKIQKSNPKADIVTLLVANASFTAFCIFILFGMIILHQEWQSRSQNVRGQRMVLGGVSNALGFSLMFVFILGVKGV